MPDEIDNGLDVTAKQKGQAVVEELAAMRRDISQNAAAIKRAFPEMTNGEAAVEYQGSTTFKGKLENFKEEVKSLLEKENKKADEIVIQNEKIQKEVETVSATVEDLKSMYATMKLAPAPGDAKSNEADTEAMFEYMYRHLTQKGLVKLRHDPNNCKDMDLDITEKYMQTWCKHSGIKYDEKTSTTLNYGNAGAITTPPLVWRRIIDQQMREFSGIIPLTTSIPVSSQTMQFLTVNTHGSAGWTAEGKTRPDTDVMTFGDETIKLYAQYFRFFLTYEQLIHSSRPLMMMLRQDCGEALTLLTENAIVVGSGIGKPRGFLGDDRIGSTNQNEADTISNIDGLIKLKQTLKTMYRANKSALRFLFNSLTSAILQLLKYGDGTHMLRSVTGDGDLVILGTKTAENEDMPDVGAGTTPIALANWKKFLATLRPTFAAITVMDEVTQAQEGKVGIQVTTYTGAGTLATEACKLLKIQVNP